MTRTLRHATFAVCAGMIVLALSALPARAIDINNLPDWVRDSIHPVEIDWSQVYPGLAAPPAWAQEPAAVQEVHPGAGSPQAAGIGTLSTVSPAGPAGALNVAHPTTAATGGLQTVSPSPLGGLQTASPASGLGGIGGLAPVHPSAAATAGLHEVNPAPAAMAGLHEVKPGSSVSAGLEPVSAGPIVGQINRLAPTDTQAQQLLLTWSAQLRDGTLDREGVKQIIAEQNVPSDTLIGVLNGLPLAHPMDPLYLPVCETLWQRTGEKLDTCLTLAYAPRIYMATYLGTIAREEDAKTLLSSLANPNKMALGADLYHVANELAFYRGKTPVSPRLAIWAWKTGSTLRGAADQAFVCSHIAQTCRRVDDPELTRQELIPWGEESLARPGSDMRWPLALSALLWAYSRTGNTHTGIERGLHWLRAAEEGGLCPCDFGMARTKLVRLCEDIGDFGTADSVLPPVCGSVLPSKVSVHLRVGERVERVIRINGNASLRALAALCEAPWAEASLGGKVENGEDSIAEVRVAIGPFAHVGSQTAVLAVTTNGQVRERLEIPLMAEAHPPVQAEAPGGLDFREAAVASTTQVKITSALPFHATLGKVVPEDIVYAEIIPEDAHSCILRAALRGAGPWAGIHGYITIDTGLDLQPQLLVPVTVP